MLTSCQLVFLFLMVVLGMKAALTGLVILLLRRQVEPAKATLVPGGIPALQVHFEPSFEQNIPLPALPCRIGRGEPNDVDLPSRHVSRQHAQIHASRNTYFITDLGSKNGTFVNGRRLQNRSVRLKSGDRLRFGREAWAEFRLQADRDLTF
jgi:pSer/pThr/pTyr-binding forkhead associated (FHA) protein